jgi:hypothetical protein
MIDLDFTTSTQPDAESRGSEANACTTEASGTMWMILQTLVLFLTCE